MESSVLKKFPSIVVEESGKEKDKKNPAIQLYGKRYYSGQTPVEYLAEFLLVFTSPKFKEVAQSKSEPKYSGHFQFCLDYVNMRYYPKDRVALKLFAFFATSKLETRHPAHRQAYLNALDKISGHIDEKSDQKNIINLLQSLFNGFVGVASNRTWVTHAFLPASENLLAREINWLHDGKTGAKNKKLSWEDDESRSELMRYFSHDRHNFMARGGEVLFLQLVNLFQSIQSDEIKQLVELTCYQHLADELDNLQSKIEYELKYLLTEGVGALNNLVEFLENSLQDYSIDERPGTLGWIPSASKVEALLFASEILNICKSSLGNLEKLDLLQSLCCLHVLRSHCFQANRLSDTKQETQGFIGNYVWVVSSETAPSDNIIRKMSEESFQKVDNIQRCILHHNALIKPSSYEEAKKHGYDIFRKIAKEIGLVIPKTGGKARFTLNQKLLRFLVTALIRPGENIRLDQFYERIFAHYGIAIGNQLAEAVKWINSQDDKDTYSVASNNQWIEKTLKQNNFLIKLGERY